MKTFNGYKNHQLTNHQLTEIGEYFSIQFLSFKYKIISL